MYYTHTCTCATLNSEITSTSDELFEGEVDLQKLKILLPSSLKRLTSSSSDDTTCQMIIKLSKETKRELLITFNSSHSLPGYVPDLLIRTVITNTWKD